MNWLPSILPHFHIHIGRKQPDRSLGLVPTGTRVVRPMPESLSSLVPAPTDNNVTVKKYGADPVKDTVPLIKSMVRRQLWQGRKLAAKLKGKTLEETARNNWQFIMNYIQYAQDAEGQEQVRSLRRLVADKKGDCDCYTVALLNLFTNQGVKAKIRIAKYNGSPDYSHVYVIVPRPDGSYITVDPVVHKFNHEVPFTDKKDFDMKLVGLDGLGECGVQQSHTIEPGTNQVLIAPQRDAVFTVPSKGLRYQGLINADEMLDSINLPYTEAVDTSGAPVYNVSTPSGIKQINQLIPIGERDAMKASLLTPPSENSSSESTGFSSKQKKNAAITLISLSALGLVLSTIDSRKKTGAIGLGAPKAHRVVSPKKMAVVHI